MPDTPLSTALTAYRAREGLTQRELAERLDIPLGTIEDMSKGRAGNTTAGKIAAWALNRL